MSTNGRIVRSGVIGFLLGAAAGLSAGMLLAPEKGARTRRRIAKASRRWGEQAAERFEAAGESVTHLRHKVG